MSDEMRLDLALEEAKEEERLRAMYPAGTKVSITVGNQRHHGLVVIDSRKSAFAGQLLFLLRSEGTGESWWKPSGEFRASFEGAALIG
jgi:hypothetical protein